jgi:NTE family protein
MAKRRTKRISHKLKEIEAELPQAVTFEEWQALAEAHDKETGGDTWRQNDESHLYDASSITLRLQRLRRLRKKKDDKGLLFALNEGIHGNMAGMGQAKLYQRAKTGTKHLIEEYIDEIRDSLEYLSPREFEGIPWAERMEFFQRASHCYGRSALMLSGGGTLGYFHFGVLKSLIEQELCPVVISGASAGAFVAAIVGTRSDKEFLDLFKDNFLARALTENRGNIKIGFGKNNNVDMRVIKREMAKLIPDMTFQEAYEKTGRSISITISPAEPNQTSRLLNHIASPTVTIRSAVLASSALPGVFQPVQLQARNIDGDIQTYLPSRRWIDGSFSQDLPAKRLTRMYGINHFIVSQVMPMPGVGSVDNTRPGIRKVMSDASIAATKQVVRGSLDFIQRYAKVNILPGYGVSNLSKLLQMLTEEEMADLILAGERATWPRLPVIRVTTRIGRALDRILHAFEVDEAHWLKTAPQTDAALKIDSREKKPRKKTATAKRSKRVAAIIEDKAAVNDR